ncbi:phosphotransferase [Microvirga alba]|uniref:Hydroxylysine kinase n=1 Tax=Microvirga alba TaxID=2791025 RepID=A0A931BL87_9HYPH|nr:phosphotransferase [Microvirga alba]MBF9233311.1 phosphotransferase [Microvirga alba]
MTADHEAGIGETLTMAARPVPLAEAEVLAREHYGLSAIAHPLSSERDQNFHLKAEDGRDYVLKITHPAEDRRVSDMQTQALLHAASVNPDLPIQHVVRARNGQPELSLPFSGDSAIRVVRIVTFTQGEPLHKVQRTSAQRRDLGRSLARLGLALRGFFHPAAGHDLLWDLKQASRVREILVHIQDSGRRALATRFLDNFEHHALPLLPGLRAQVIHNDLNPHNVLVRPDDHDRVAGILDFGDLVHAPLICDVAVAAAYQLSEVGNPLEAAVDFVAAYHAVAPLERAEIDLLFDLIATRLVLIVAISGWRASTHPENRDYILRNNPAAWSGLERLAGLSRQEAQAFLRRACDME